MRWINQLGIACVMTIASTAPAIACPPPPPPVPFPGENDADYAARAKIMFEHIGDEDRRAAQVRWFDDARSIQLARVVTSNPVAIGGWGVPVEGHAITAKAIKTLKGDPPDGPLAMADRTMTSCGIGGGGLATSEKPGALIVVFTNVDDRRGPKIFGVPISAARDPRLMAALNDAALSLRDSNKDNR